MHTPETGDLVYSAPSEKLRWTRELAATVPNYSISSPRIWLPYSYPDEPRSVPYNLSDDEYPEWASDVNVAMHILHEYTHYLQHWATTNGLLESLLWSFLFKQLLHIERETEHDRPLIDYYERLLSRDSGHTSAQRVFLRSFGGFVTIHLIHQWLAGLLPDKLLRESLAADWQEELPDCFYTCRVAFGSGSDGEPDGPRRYGVSNYYRAAIGAPEEAPEYCLGIGVRQLMECFASSVVLENRLWFNPRYATGYIHEFLHLERNRLYNLPAHALQQVAELLWNPKPDLNPFWAHVRVFIDIALMYSDLLFATPEELSKDCLTSRLLAAKVQPGITYFRVLSAFSKCRPLKNHKEDVLRLYDEICAVLGIPTLDEMNERLLSLVEQVLRNGDRIPLSTRPYLETAQRLLERRKETPLLFINDLIYPDKTKPLDELLRDTWCISTPSEGIGAGTPLAMSVELLQTAAWELLRHDSIRCPRQLMGTEQCEGPQSYRLCALPSPSASECVDCPVGPFLREYLSIA